MEIFPLSKLQVIKLADFFFDVAKGALLAGLGFSLTAPGEFITRISLFTGGMLFGIMSLYFGLWLIKGVEK